MRKTLLEKVEELNRQAVPVDLRYTPPLEEQLAGDDPGPLVDGKALPHRFKRLRDRK